MDCLFCQIIKKEKGSHIVYEDEAVFAFLDIFPRAIGHTLVLPKEHVETILDLDNSKVGSVFEGVKKVTEILKRGLNPDGFTIGINHGKVSGQVVEHLHIHIIPRFKDDEGGSIHGVVNNPPNIDLDEVLKRIDTR